MALAFSMHASSSDQACIKLVGEDEDDFVAMKDDERDSNEMKNDWSETQDLLKKHKLLIFVLCAVLLTALGTMLSNIQTTKGASKTQGNYNTY